MYRFSDAQLRFSDFGQPIGMKLNKENRWVRKAELIPWDEIEKRYAKLFPGYKGNPAKPLRLALGALLIQSEYGYSDQETMLQIQEGPYLQYFCGLPKYEDKKPFDSSTMVWFRKRLTPKVIAEINELILKRYAERQKTQKKNGKDSSNKQEKEKKKSTETTASPDTARQGDNKGTVIMDATCAPQNIRYPQDLSLLNECREKLEDMIDDLCEQSKEPKPRIYRKKARKDFLLVSKRRRKSAQLLRKGIGKQLHYVSRDLKQVEKLVLSKHLLTTKQSDGLKVYKKLFEQQSYMYRNHCHTVKNRIVSIAQPWIRPIVRGKVKAPTEFGTKLDISVVNGFARLEFASFNAYNEAENLQEIIERYHKRMGCYPERVLADKIYRNRKNLTFCKEHHIRLSGPALGRPKKEAMVNDQIKKIRRQDESDRIEVERDFSLAKAKCGLGLIREKLRETTQSVVALSIVALNLAKIWPAYISWALKLPFSIIVNPNFFNFAFAQ